jgi:hypothetical protein
VNSPFYGDLARLYRLLVLADSAAVAAEVDLAPLSGPIELTHAERKLAQRALLNLLKQNVTPPSTSRAALLWHFFRLHPLRAIKLVLKG